MEKVIGYIRVSTETQADEGYGLETQRMAIEKYCQDNNLILDRIIDIDAGISGTKEDRAGIIELFMSLEETGIKKVIVMNTSRLWRDLNNKVMVTKQLMAYGATVCSIEQPQYDMYSKDPQDFLYNSILEIFDQYDRMMTNLKLAKGRKTKGRKGYKPCGSAPLGYDWNSNKEIVVNKKEAEIVKCIFDAYLDRKTLGKTKKVLDHFNFKTKNGNNFSKLSIALILQNDFYIGIVTHAGVKVKGHHEPIIDEKTFNKVQRLYAKGQERQKEMIKKRELKKKENEENERK